MNETMRPQPAHADLLPQQYPAYSFTSIPRPEGWSYIAQAKRLGTRPWCVVTKDPADFQRELEMPTKARP